VIYLKNESARILIFPLALCGVDNESCYCFTAGGSLPWLIQDNNTIDSRADATDLDSSQCMQDEVGSASLKILVTVIGGGIFLLNLATIIAISCVIRQFDDRRSRLGGRKPVLYCIGNLAVADMMAGLLLLWIFDIQRVRSFYLSDTISRSRDAEENATKLTNNFLCHPWPFVRFFLKVQSLAKLITYLRLFCNLRRSIKRFSVTCTAPLTEMIWSLSLRQKHEWNSKHELSSKHWYNRFVFRILI